MYKALDSLFIQPNRYFSYSMTYIFRALAKVCNAPIDNKNGATSKDWRGGKPVRVVRNVKGRKHSEYAPEEGNRYDGIYKVNFTVSIIRAFLRFSG